MKAFSPSHKVLLQEMKRNTIRNQVKYATNYSYFVFHLPDLSGLRGAWLQQTVDLTNPSFLGIPRSSNTTSLFSFSCPCDTLDFPEPVGEIVETLCKQSGVASFDRSKMFWSVPKQINRYTLLDWTNFQPFNFGW